MEGDVGEAVTESAEEERQVADKPTESGIDAWSVVILEEIGKRGWIST